MSAAMTTHWTHGAIFSRLYADEAKTQPLAEVRILSNKHWEAIDCATGEVLYTSARGGPPGRTDAVEEAELWARVRVSA